MVIKMFVFAIFSVISLFGAEKTNGGKIKQLFDKGDEAYQKKDYQGLLNAMNGCLNLNPKQRLSGIIECNEWDALT